MNLQNKSKIVMDWLMQCPQIRDLFFGFTQAESGNRMFVPIPDERCIKEFLDESAVKSYELALIAYQTFSDVPNSDENTEIQFDLEKIMNWVEEQNEAENFPDLPNVEEVKCLENMPNLSGVDEQCAKYMFTIQIIYMERK